MRINELAREVHVKAKIIVNYLQQAGFEGIRSHSSMIDDEVAEKVRKYMALEKVTEPARITRIVERLEAAECGDQATSPKRSEAEKTNAATKPPARTVRTLVFCPVCGVQLRPYRISRHTMKVHSGARRRRVGDSPRARRMSELEKARRESVLAYQQFQDLIFQELRDLADSSHQREARQKPAAERRTSHVSLAKSGGASAGRLASLHESAPSVVGLPRQTPRVLAEMSRHILKGLVPCPNCGVQLRPERLDRHVARVHSVKGRRPVAAKKNGLVLRSPRGTRVQSGSCAQCSISAKTLWRYTKKDGEPLVLCERCKHRILGRPLFWRKILSGGAFESNRRRH